MVQEKREIVGQACLNKTVSLFYCNSRKAILNPHQPQEKRSFSESFWCRFFQKGAVLR